MTLLTRLAAAVIATAPDARDEVMAEVARLRGTAEPDGAGHQHRYDPASTTSCIAEHADGSEPWSAGITLGDIPREPPHGFGFTHS